MKRSIIHDDDNHQLDLIVVKKRLTPHAKGLLTQINNLKHDIPLTELIDLVDDTLSHEIRRRLNGWPLNWYNLNNEERRNICNRPRKLDEMVNSKIMELFPGPGKPKGITVGYDHHFDHPEITFRIDPLYAGKSIITESSYICVSNPHDEGYYDYEICSFDHAQNRKFSYVSSRKEVHKVIKEISKILIEYREAGLEHIAWIKDKGEPILDNFDLYDQECILFFRWVMENTKLILDTAECIYKDYIKDL
jgi:RimJ/RimL family protein N-acetyltransferase